MGHIIFVWDLKEQRKIITRCWSQGFKTQTRTINTVVQSLSFLSFKHARAQRYTKPTRPEGRGVTCLWRELQSGPCFFPLVYWCRSVYYTVIFLKKWLQSSFRFTGSWRQKYTAAWHPTAPPGLTPHVGWHFCCHDETPSLQRHELTPPVYRRGCAQWAVTGTCPSPALCSSSESHTSERDQLWLAFNRSHGSEPQPPLLGKGRLWLPTAQDCCEDCCLLSTEQEWTSDTELWEGKQHFDVPQPR